MPTEPFVFYLVVIFAGATVVAGLALAARQSLPVAYILLGALAGPWGFGLIGETHTVQSIGQVGIIFLLFLLGLNLHPQKLSRMLGEAVLVTAASAMAFALAGFAVAYGFGFSLTEATVVAVACTFSSTILALKLLPTTALHHRHAGEIIISVLLLQDLAAILALVVVQGLGESSSMELEAMKRLAAVPALAAGAMLVQRYLFFPLLTRYDRVQEFLFLSAIGWCLAVAQIGYLLGLSHELGAFIAGVSFASNRVSTFVAETLKPLRDFFLVMFFFALGAAFPLPELPGLIIPAALLACGLAVLKPWVFRRLLEFEGEPAKLSKEIGARLGQMSEFSLLLAQFALTAGVIGSRAAHFIQAATLLSFIISASVIVSRYPTPIAFNDALRQD